MNHYDVIIVGAGISGVSAAVHLQQRCPSKTWTILEGRDAIGGTWDLFRYPGIRSDSDMHTLGFRFKPWTDAKAIADGPAILKYVNATIDEFKLREKIQHGQRVTKAAWSSDDVCWKVTVSRTGGAAQRGTNEQAETTFTGNFLFICGGYYNYEQPHDPEFKNVAAFKGQVLHPQFWPEGMHYAGKKVVVIGSGATAMTLVPNIATQGAEVTMVQRSPTYVVSLPARDKIANMLRKFLPDKLAYIITRFKNVELQRFFYRQTRTAPLRVKNKLLALVRKHLGPEYDVDKHFTPTYNPWDQRLCLIPDADLFNAINAGTVKVVTEHIDCFTEDGLKLSTGEVLPADIIVTATGLKLTVLAGLEISVDDKRMDLAKTWSYKGMMYSDIPNLAQTFGYINASWTLRADLISEYVCRLLNHLDKKGMRQVTPRLRPEDEGMPARPWIDSFTAGYMQRSMHLFPKQGDAGCWRNTQDFKQDRKMIRHAPIEEDAALRFEKPVRDGELKDALLEEESSVA